MDQLLIASGWLDLDFWFGILQVAIGLGLVIFVHELGHFAVAKMCGVRCDKFYLGFDIYGLKLAKFKWGETEYGIGILPLGGYVKMLGQEDNPARLKEELEQAKLRTQQPEGETAEGETAEKKNADKKKSTEEEIDIKAAEEALFDPRSYLAQSVPKRMAIISAGVIMNLIFAVIMATAAFGMGVERMTPVIGMVVPGGAAWEAGLESGDKVVSIEDKKMSIWRDTLEGITLGDKIEEGLPIVIQRPGVKEPLKFVIKPDATGKMPRLGIVNSRSTLVGLEEFAAYPGTPAADSGLESGDKIIAADGRPIASYRELQAYLALHPEKPIEFTVEREKKDSEGKSEEIEAKIAIGPNHMRRMGLVMEMGEISVIQKGSPAEEAGIKVGDVITKIDNQPVGDPMTLADRLRRRAGERVVITVEREDEPNEPIDLKVKLRPVDWLETYMIDDSPMSIPALGVAFPILNRVHSTVDGSPAEKAGLQRGDVLTEATIIPPEEQTPEEEAIEQTKKTLKLEENHRNWPMLILALQDLLPETKVQLKWKRKDKKGENKEATLALYEDKEWFNPERGMILEADKFIQKGEGVLDSARLGFNETVHATLTVYRFLQKLGTQQISATSLGGPISIFVVARLHAKQGLPALLIFLTMLSANLAVLNFLPIPLLDGGHMVFLAYEGIRGKPASENIQLALTYVGLFFILGLMFWVIGLDVFRMIYGW